MMSLCWSHKSSNVRTPVKSKNEVSMNETFWKAGDCSIQPSRPFDRPMPLLVTTKSLTSSGIRRQFFDYSLGICLNTSHGLGFKTPTRAEMILRRLCSVFLFSNHVLFEVIETSASWYRMSRWQRSLEVEIGGYRESKIVKGSRPSL